MARRIEMMIDLECAGPAPRGAIVSIGYCFFALDGQVNSTGEVFGPVADDAWGRIPVDVQSCLDIGMEMDEKTIREFWFKQPTEVRSLWGERGAKPITSALHELCRLYSQFCCYSANRGSVWAYPATYDLTILDNAYVLANIRPRWGRQDLLCARSAMRGARFDRSTVAIPPKWSEKHFPECDAVRQAIQLQACLIPFHKETRP